MGRPTVWILGDQLLERHPALDARQPDEIRVLLVESKARTERLPYQKQKLVLLFSAMRHYAESLRERGFEVDYRQSATFLDGLQDHITQFGVTDLITMSASSYEGRRRQHRLSDELGITVRVLPNSQFLVEAYNPIPEPEPDKRYVMESFYRQMRRHFDVLMDGDDPEGGRWNFDKENRQRLPTSISLPKDYDAAPDTITQAVLSEQGLDATRWAGYAVTRAQALEALDLFLSRRLEYFGPYEDAMTARSHTLFHSVLSPYLNIGLLEPMELIRSAEKRFHEGLAPLNSVEGFVRQILGWREFMYWQYWRQMPAMLNQNAWAASREVPGFFWDGDTPLSCMHHALRRALDTGYNHHIERLMLLSNFMMLAGIKPRAANDWFLSVYIDAYDWVMPPNVIGMGLNADDGVTATKPYIASANYINKMSDHCRDCRFNPKLRTGEDACPFNYLYWNFLIQHEEKLRANPRFGPAVLGLGRLDAAERRRVQAAANAFLSSLTDST